MVNWKMFRWRYLTRLSRKRVLWNLRDVQEYYTHRW
jgi:hypothetical protein